MPIYEYACKSCGKHFDEMQKFSDPALTDCPTCGKPSLERLVSASAFHLKGGGYYATDYKKTETSATPHHTTKPAETKPAETKATETKTTDTKTAETKKSSAKKEE